MKQLIQYLIIQINLYLFLYLWRIIVQIVFKSSTHFLYSCYNEIHL